MFEKSYVWCQVGNLPLMKKLIMKKLMIIIYLQFLFFSCSLIKDKEKSRASEFVFVIQKTNDTITFSDFKVSKGGVQFAKIWISKEIKGEPKKRLMSGTLGITNIAFKVDNHKISYKELKKYNINSFYNLNVDTCIQNFKDSIWCAEYKYLLKFKTHP